jgi:hypothetical protein
MVKGMVGEKDNAETLRTQRSAEEIGEVVWEADVLPKGGTTCCAPSVVEMTALGEGDF